MPYRSSILNRKYFGLGVWGKDLCLYYEILMLDCRRYGWDSDMGNVECRLAFTTATVKLSFIRKKIFAVIFRQTSHIGFENKQS